MTSSARQVVQMTLMKRKVSLNTSKMTPESLILNAIKTALGRSSASDRARSSPSFSYEQCLTVFRSFKSSRLLHKFNISSFKLCTMSISYRWTVRPTVWASNSLNNSSRRSLAIYVMQTLIQWINSRTTCSVELVWQFNEILPKKRWIKLAAISSTHRIFSFSSSC